MSNDHEVDFNEDALLQFFIQNNSWCSKLSEMKKKAKKQKQEQNTLFSKSNQVQVFINPESPNKKTIRTQPLVIDRFSLKRMFVNMTKVLEQIDHKTGIVSNLKVRNFLDICCSPGGCTQYILSKTSSTQSKGTGYALAKEHNGMELLLPKKENRFQVINLDITKKLPEVPPKAQNELVVLNGWKLNGYLETGDIQVPSSLLPDLPQPESNTDESASPVIHTLSVEPALLKQYKSLHRKMLMISQLLTGLTCLTRGGNLLLLMKYKEKLFYASVITILEKSFDKVQVLKPSILESPEVTDKSLFAVACINFKSKEMVPILRKAWNDLSQGEDVKSLHSISLQEASQLCGFLDPIWMSDFTAFMKSNTDFESDPTTLQDLSNVLDWTQVNETAKKFSYANDGDTNGLIYFLTQGDVKSPNSPVIVTCSATAVGTPLDFISRDRARSWTSNHPYAWYCVDLGDKNRVIPTHYTLGYGSSGTACIPRNWILQGANKLSRNLPQYNHNDLPQNDPDWKTLSIHANDTSINQEWGTCTWSLNCRRAYRYLRVVQTGPNSFASQSTDDQWSLVFVMNRFEVYGYFLPDPNLILMTPAPVAVQTGSSSGLQPYQPPIIVRADPTLMREVHELLAQLVRQQNNDTKAEKVRVHEIVLDQ